MNTPLRFTVPASLMYLMQEGPECFEIPPIDSEKGTKV